MRVVGGTLVLRRRGGARGGGTRLLVAALAIGTTIALVPSDSHAAEQRQRERDCSQTSAGLVPLTDLGPDAYQGAQGGLYPGGSNDIPPAHLAVGLRRAAAIQPRDTNGDPDANGSIVFASIGFSNPMREFGEFLRLADAAPDLDPRVIVVNGAQGGQDLRAWIGPRGRPWRGLDQALADAGVTPEQVQAVWIKQTVRVTGSPQPFPTGALTYRDQFLELAQLLQQRLPNLQIGYVSTRTYGGYGGDLSPSPEPGAYEEGFGAKWAIERQITGDPAVNADPAAGPVRAPWLAWGPYLWADGTTARSDGLTWLCEEVRPDGAHLETAGNQKVAAMLLSFLQEEPTAAWMFTDRELPAPPTDLGEPIPTSTIAGDATTPPATTSTPPTTTSSTPSPEPATSTVPTTPGPDTLPAPAASGGPPPIVWVLVGAGGSLLLAAIAIAIGEARRRRRTE